MADVYTRIGYIKGATGATGAQGAKGDTGDAATIQVGSVTTVPYGQTANVVNSGTEQAAVFDFTIPQGRPGQQTTEMDDLTLNAITTSSASFPIPAIGETGKVLFGKIVKWFSDMSALVATKLDTANVVNNLTTTASGYALDARQGKAINDGLAITDLTTSIVMESGISYTSRRLIKFKRFIFFDMVLPSLASGLTKVCTIPTAGQPLMLTALSIASERSADRTGRQEASVSSNGIIYITRDNAAGGPVSISGVWETGN